MKDAPTKPSCEDVADSGAVARQMLDAITYLINVASGANLPRVAHLLSRVRGELLLVEVAAELLTASAESGDRERPRRDLLSRRQRH